MSIIPPFTPFLDDKVKVNITSHVRKRLTMGHIIQSTTITGVNITNWADVIQQNTLHRQLTAIGSIYDKTVVNSKERSIVGVYFTLFF